MNCIFSIDVEDWYHLLDLPTTPPIEQWAALPSRVERNFLELLDTLGQAKAKSDLFFSWLDC
jgi:hypothetical protein